MTNKRDLKSYIRYDGNGRVVPGGNILQRKPPKVGKWEQESAYLCCDPSCVPVVYGREGDWMILSIYGSETDVVISISTIIGVSIQLGLFCNEELITSVIVPASSTDYLWTIPQELMLPTCSVCARRVCNGAYSSWDCSVFGGGPS